MTVDQLRELLETMPGHVPVQVEVPTRMYPVGGPGADYIDAADCAVENFAVTGRAVVIKLHEPMP